MRILIVDNYDSFTFNLFQLTARVTGTEPVVVRNDQLSLRELRTLACDCAILSPGPGRPDKPGDFGICAEILEESSIPVLGVCLGHQGIAHFFGAKVVHAPEPIHGRTSSVYHDESGLFRGLPQGFKVARYHSLHVVEPLPNELEATAWTSDGIVMGLRHLERPLWGVQFHPESICTEHGAEVIANFAALSRACGDRKRVSQWSSSKQRISVVPQARSAEDYADDEAPFEVVHRKLDLRVDPEHVFVTMFADTPTPFWLDSSRVEAGVSRFSYMGGDVGRYGQVVSYRAAKREITVVENGGLATQQIGPLLQYLERQIERHRVAKTSELPFDFRCGFVGYLGYELKGDCGSEITHRAPHPDAQLVLADRFVAFDHEARCVYLVALTDRSGDERDEATAWLDATEERLAALPPLAEVEPAGGPSRVSFRWSRDRKQYLRDVEESLRLIRDGETYEVCLTNQLYATTDIDPLAFYRTLRRTNPAPHAAYLRFGNMTIASSSPERFLKIDRDGGVETKPIKGTAPRGDTVAEDFRNAEKLRACEKARSENMMITDLLRNDLGVVCEIGSVHTPALMHVESFETVHQLVTTIRGKLRRGISPLECIRASFPGGSMTGAPKMRTLRIIDDLEIEARGVYSGAIGFLSLDGAVDLNIVIRTAIFSGGEAKIGVGGAIVALSDPEDEFDEIVLKARALIHAILVTAHGEEGARARTAKVETFLRSETPSSPEEIRMPA